MLIGVQVVILKEVKVCITQRKPQGSQKICCKVSNIPILPSLINGDNIKNKREHDNKNGEEYEKCSKIFHNLHYHGHDITKFHEDSQEEEQFHQAEEDHYDHDTFWNDFQGFHVQLAVDVEIPQADVRDVQEVPWVLTVLLNALHHQLVTVVDQWID